MVDAALRCADAGLGRVTPVVASEDAPGAPLRSESLTLLFMACADTNLRGLHRTFAYCRRKQSFPSLSPREGLLKRDTRCGQADERATHVVRCRARAQQRLRRRQ